MRLRSRVLIAAQLFAVGCSDSWSEIHLVPEGFRGSVVIVYGCGSAEPTPSEGEASLYRIPASGILLTSDPSRDGWVDDAYFYLSAQGTRTPLAELDSEPKGLGVSRRQAVAWYEGPLDAPVVRSNRSAAQYFVGDESDRSDWYSRSEAQLEQARELVKRSCPPAA